MQQIDRYEFQDSEKDLWIELGCIYFSRDTMSAAAQIRESKHNMGINKKVDFSVLI